MKRKTYHVFPVGGLWGVKRTGARRPSMWCTVKSRAIYFAKHLVRTSRQPGQIVVHGSDGKIQTEWTYGCDPRRTRG